MIHLLLLAPPLPPTYDGGGNRGPLTSPSLLELEEDEEVGRESWFCPAARWEEGEERVKARGDMVSDLHHKGSCTGVLGEEGGSRTRRETKGKRAKSEKRLQRGGGQNPAIGRGA